MKKPIKLSFENLFSFFVLIMISYILIVSKQNENSCEKYGKYTFGTVYKVYYWKGSKEALMMIKVNGKNNIGGGAIKDRNIKIGDRFLVKYDSTSIDYNAHEYFDVPIPDSILTAPDEGWLYPPFRTGLPVDTMHSEELERNEKLEIQKERQKEADEQKKQPKKSFYIKIPRN
jgi:hypothetical protein